MQFSFSDQQLEFRDTVRHLLDRECTAGDLRAAFGQPVARTPRWRALTELGVVGLTVPEAQGGLGLGMTDLVLLLEEAGRAGLPEPLLETTALTGSLLARAPHTATGALLSAIATGDVTAAVAPRGARPATDAPTGCSGARGDAGLGIRVTDLVPAAMGADVLLLVIDDDGRRPELHAVRAAQSEVTPVPTLDPTRRMGNVSWDPSPSSRIAVGEEAHLALVDLADLASVSTAAELLGLADRLIATTTAYARERHQFGKPIGSFQAVKHLLAGAQVKLEFARPAVYAAAWSLDEAMEPGERDRTSRSASLAKACASDAAAEAARVSLQVHGAVGYTWECDLQLYLKRTWALAEAWGSAKEHRRRILASLLDELDER